MAYLWKIELSTRELASKAYMGDKVFIDGKKKSYIQLKCMLDEPYSVLVSYEGAINILHATKIKK